MAQTKLQINESRQYLYDIQNVMMEKKKLPVNHMHKMGGRFGGKTFDTLIFNVECLINPKFNVAIYPWRADTANAKELFNEYMQVVESYLPYGSYRVNKTERSITFGKSFIKIGGMNSMKKSNTATKTGMASAQNADYIIIHLEEAYEFAKNEKSSIIESIRGSKETIDTLVVETSNPWFASHWYVTQMRQVMPFKESILKSKGEQFKKDGKTVYHWTNWRVNPDFMTEDRHAKIAELWKIDPERAKVVDLGIPGNVGSGVYTTCIKSLQNPFFNPSSYIYGGVDWGEGEYDGASWTVCVLGTVQLGRGMEIISEYTHNNDDYSTTVNGKKHTGGKKDTGQLTREICEFIYNSVKDNEFYHFTGVPIVIKVDNANAGQIFTLNQFARSKGWETMMVFQKCDKHPINDRIQFVKTAITNGDLRISQGCTRLRQELENSTYVIPKSDVRQTPKRDKTYDHAINAMEYMLDHVQYEYMDNGFKHLLDKGW